MANKKSLWGMLAIALVFALMFISCDDSEGNPYEGEWRGTFPQKNGTETEATITFTETEWTLKAGEITLTGTYTYIGGKLATATLSEGNYSVASATMLGNGLTVTFNNGDHKGSTGHFIREHDTPLDPFKGKWSGKFTPTSSSQIAATITFTDTEWTLSFGGTEKSGEYTKSKIRLTADLKNGTYSAGSAVYNPVNKTLTVYITGITDSKGSGSFKRD